MFEIIVAFLSGMITTAVVCLIIISSAIKTLIEEGKEDSNINR